MIVIARSDWLNATGIHVLQATKQSKNADSFVAQCSKPRFASGNDVNNF